MVPSDTITYEQWRDEYDRSNRALRESRGGIPALVYPQHGVREGFVSLDVFRREDVSFENVNPFVDEDTPLDLDSDREFAIEEMLFYRYFLPFTKDFLEGGLFDGGLIENRMIGVGRLLDGETRIDIEFQPCLEHNFYRLDVVAKAADELDQVSRELAAIDRAFWTGSSEPARLSELAMRWLNLYGEDGLVLLQVAGLYREVSARLYEISHRLSADEYVLSVMGP